MSSERTGRARRGWPPAPPRCAASSAPPRPTTCSRGLQTSLTPVRSSTSFAAACPGRWRWSCGWPGEGGGGHLPRRLRGRLCVAFGGLTALLAEGLIHRDICPSHVYLRPAAVAAGAVGGGECGGAAVALAVGVLAELRRGPPPAPPPLRGRWGGGAADGGGSCGGGAGSNGRGADAGGLSRRTSLVGAGVVGGVAGGVATLGARGAAVGAAVGAAAAAA